MCPPHRRQVCFSQRRLGGGGLRPPAAGIHHPRQGGKVLRLRKALYDLQQAPRAWNAKLDATLKTMGFVQSPHEATVYRWGKDGYALLVGIYVDDLVITDAKDDEVEAFKEMKVSSRRATWAPLLLLGDRGAPR